MHAATFLRKNGAGFPLGFRALGFRVVNFFCVMPGTNSLLRPIDMGVIGGRA